MDGAHEVPFVELTSKLAERTTAYRYPGPVLSAAVEGAVTAALGPRGSSQSALAKRVTAHWGLGRAGSPALRSPWPWAPARAAAVAAVTWPR